MPILHNRPRLAFNQKEKMACDRLYGAVGETRVPCLKLLPDAETVARMRRQVCFLLPLLVGRGGRRPHLEP